MINWIFAAVLATAYVLETTVMHSLAIFGVIPSLTLIVVIACAINRGREIALVIGLIVGLVVDLLSGNGFGSITLMYVFAACVAGMMGSTFLGKNPVTAMLICAIIVAVFGMTGSAIRFAVGIDRNFAGAVLRYVLINAVYSSVIEFFVYTLIDGISVRFYQRRG